MKKLLSLLGSLSLTAVASIGVVSCTTGVNVKNISVLQASNFALYREIADLAKDPENVGKTLGDLSMVKELGDNGAKALFNSNGMYNNFVKENSLVGTFTGTKSVGFLDAINNDKDLLGGKKLKAKVDFKDFDDKPSNDLSYKDISGNLSVSLDNFDELKSIKIDSIDSNYKFDGDTVDYVHKDINDAKNRFSLLLKPNKTIDEWEKLLNNTEQKDGINVKKNLDGTYWLSVKFSNKDGKSISHKLAIRITGSDLFMSFDKKTSQENFKLKKLIDDKVKEKYSWVDTLSYAKDIRSELGINSDTPIAEQLILNSIDLFDWYQSEPNSLLVSCTNIYNQINKFIDGNGVEKFITDFTNEKNQSEFLKELGKTNWASEDGKKLSELGFDKDKYLSDIALNKTGIPDSLSKDDWLKNNILKIDSLDKIGDYALGTITDKQNNQILSNLSVSYIDSKGNSIKGDDNIAVEAALPDALAKANEIGKDMAQSILDKGNYYTDPLNKKIYEVKDFNLYLVKPQDSSKAKTNFDDTPDTPKPMLYSVKCILLIN